MNSQNNTPYCGECGYELTGLTESAKCPECGLPLVDVLVRPSFQKHGKRYTSSRTFCGLPFITVASGPYGAERIGKPVGFIAIGDMPRGVIAIGGIPRGIIALGGIPVGLISLGGVSLGGLAMGGVAIGAVALGGSAIGLFIAFGAAARVLFTW